MRYMQRCKQINEIYTKGYFTMFIFLRIKNVMKQKYNYVLKVAFVSLRRTLELLFSRFARKIKYREFISVE